MKSGEEGPASGVGDRRRVCFDFDFLGVSQLAEPYFWYGDMGTASCLGRWIGAEHWVRIERGLEGDSRRLEDVEIDKVRSWMVRSMDDCSVFGREYVS